MIIDLDKPVYVMIKVLKAVKKVELIDLQQKTVRAEGCTWDFDEVIFLHDLKNINYKA